MNKITRQELLKYGFILITVVIVFYSFLLVKPFISILLSAAIFSYLFYPLYLKIKKKIKNPSYASLITVVIVVLLVAIPLIFALNMLFHQVVSAVDTVQNTNLVDECTSGNAVCQLTKYFSKEDKTQVQQYVTQGMSKFITAFAGWSSYLVKKVPAAIASFFVMLFIMFYMFKDGHKVLALFENVVHLEDKNKHEVIDQFANSIHAIVFGYIVVAAVQALAGTIGLFIFGIKSYLLWGLIMFVLCLIPFVGAVVVWLPASIFLGVSGYVSGNPVLMWKGIGLFIYGTVVVSSVDNLLRPKIIGTRAHIHPVMILLGVLGGLSVFGFIGIFVGPLILQAFTILAKIIYSEVVDDSTVQLTIGPAAKKSGKHHAENHRGKGVKKK